MAADIVKMTVYHLSKFVLIDPALDGARLEARADTSVFEETDPGRIRDVLDHLDEAAASPADVVPDVRWGLVFSDRSGARVRSAYIDANGAFAEVDGTRVELADDELVQWLRDIYGEDFVLS